MIRFPWSKRGFTMMELVIVIVMVLILVSVGALSFRTLLVKAKSVACESNLRGINTGLHMYVNDYGQFPMEVSPGQADLVGALAPYKVSPEMFHCPLDPNPGATYEDLYVWRISKPDARAYVIGCPYHSRGETANNLLFGYEDPQELTVLTVEHNGNPVNYGELTSLSTNDQIVFKNQQGGNFAVVDVVQNVTAAMVVGSFSLEDGTPYGIIKVDDADGEGKIDCSVESGSRFEVVTPAAIAGVQGTRFYVEMIETSTQFITTIGVIEGSVVVTQLLSAEGLTKDGKPVTVRVVEATDEPVQIKILFPPKKIKIQPRVQKVKLGEEIQFELVGWDGEGNYLGTITSPEIRWEVISGKSRGTIDQHGLYRPLRKGHDKISATYAGLRARAKVVIKKQ